MVEFWVYFEGRDNIYFGGWIQIMIKWKEEKMCMIGAPWTFVNH